MSITDSTRDRDRDAVVLSMGVKDRRADARQAPPGQILMMLEQSKLEKARRAVAKLKAQPAILTEQWVALRRTVRDLFFVAKLRAILGMLSGYNREMSWSPDFGQEDKLVSP
jgi:hypothetical protein